MPDQKWISYTTYTYEYGNCGECLTVIETDEESTITTTYTYDKLLRLTSETITDGNGTLTISYTYDNVGNHLSKTTYHGGCSEGVSYWYTPNQTVNPVADLAFPSGNTYQYMDTYIIPEGTAILEGTVAPNFGQPGGGYQYYVPDPSVVIRK